MVCNTVDTVVNLSKLFFKNSTRSALICYNAYYVLKLFELFDLLRFTNLCAFASSRPTYASAI